MDAPKCKTCGEQEWGHRCLGAVGQERPPRSEAAPEAREPSSDGALERPESGSLSPRERTKLWRAANLEHHRVYHRGYMARRRARERAAAALEAKK